MAWLDRIRRLIRTTTPPVAVDYDPRADAFWQHLDDEERHSRAEIARVHREVFPVSVLFPPTERISDGRTTDTKH